MSLIKVAVSKEKMLEAIQWMSGSSDFAPDGKARIGYLKLVQPILLEKKAIVSELAENSKDPRQLPLTERIKPQIRLKPNKTVLNWGMKK